MVSRAVIILKIKIIGISPFALRQISVHAELTLGHLLYSLNDVTPQPITPRLTQSSERIARRQTRSVVIKARTLVKRSLSALLGQCKKGTGSVIGS